jgi:phosphate transport system substrate-binding protein
MRFLSRQVGLAVLLALLLTPLLSLAQSDNSITVVGSLVAKPLFEALSQASPSPVTITVNATGTNSGFTTFCQGQADITNATSPITVAEDSTCSSNNVSYLELLLGYDIIALVTKPDAAYAQCLTSSDLDALFAPSAEGQTTNWNQVNSNDPDQPLTLIVPGQATPTFSVLDSVVEGDGLRTDVTTLNADSDILNNVAQTDGALGVVSLAAANAAGSTIQIVKLDDGKGDGCVAPSADTVEAGTYPAGRQILSYVSAASLSKPGVHDFVAFATSDASASVVTQVGFVPPTTDTYTKNASVLQNMQTGRRVTQQAVEFQIPAGVTGAVKIVGAAGGFTYIKSVSDAVTAAYSGLTPDIKTMGVTDGVKQLCSVGGADIAIVYETPTPDQTTDCATNGISTLAIGLGNQAVVLVGHASDTFQACLTKDQLLTAWKSGSDPAITNWNQVSSDFPDLAITLFAPSNGDPARDVLMIRLAGTDVADRADEQLNRDPLYRAAATANVDGGLTFMSWSEYQKVLANNQANIQLVSVDGGSGCVAPSEATIKDGTYLLARPVQLLVNHASLTNEAVQSFLWSLATEANYTLYQQSALIGLTVDDMAGLRNTLQAAFQQAATQPSLAPGATPEVGATSEATATVEASPAAEATATSEAAATSEATPASGG